MRKLAVLCPFEGIFEFHSIATKGRKDEKWAKNDNFLANEKSLIHFSKNQQTMSNAISWFEIPATNYERAKDFYNTVLETEIKDSPMPEGKYGMFPYDEDNNAVGGGLVEMSGYSPSAKGVTVYLNGGDDLNAPLARVEYAGGKVLMPKTDIGENGFMAQFIDTEGNKIALHSWN